MCEWPIGIGCILLEKDLAGGNSGGKSVFSRYTYKAHSRHFNLLVPESFESIPNMSNPSHQTAAQEATRALMTRVGWNLDQFRREVDQELSIFVCQNTLRALAGVYDLLEEKKQDSDVTQRSEVEVITALNTLTMYAEGMEVVIGVQDVDHPLAEGLGLWRSVKEDVTDLRTIVRLRRGQSDNTDTSDPVARRECIQSKL